MQSKPAFSYTLKAATATECTASRCAEAVHGRHVSTMRVAMFETYAKYAISWECQCMYSNMMWWRPVYHLFTPIIAKDVYMRLYALEAVAPRELMSNAKPAAALPHPLAIHSWLRLFIMTPATT